MQQSKLRRQIKKETASSATTNKITKADYLTKHIVRDRTVIQFCGFHNWLRDLWELDGSAKAA
ncbi:unnamed protein product [Sphenostylis stenocarpa]|uniref:Uncharacterized protein n=1 Tax=Sphenostylis stenocarpa TaxID=92480 RepID=A0AA86SWV7_9FABA|nr:unnamed protein product [Sphenostylis stenocarpa]